MHNFQNLKIWQKAMRIAKKVYLISSEFPSEEKFGLTSQIRRSAISIASNIAEGAGRNTNGEFRNFLGIANGSSNELCTQLILAYKLDLITEDKIQSIIDDLMEIQKMNYTLIQKFSSK